MRAYRPPDVAHGHTSGTYDQQIQSDQHLTFRKINQAPKSWAEQAYVKLIYYSDHPKGTHFAA